MDDDNITTLLQRIGNGDVAAHEKFSKLVYNELKKIAQGYRARERSDHTLRPTEIVHEAYMELFGKKPIKFQDRSHFYRVAALQMRRFLIDYGRARRGPERRRDLAVWVPEEMLASPAASAANTMVHELLDQMEREVPAAAEVVDLKFFSGLTSEEIAEVLHISVATVRRRWASAQKWLLRNIKASPNPRLGEPSEEDCLTGKESE